MDEPLRPAPIVDPAPYVGLLVDAFLDDPFFRALWPDRGRYAEAAREWFATDLRQLAGDARFWAIGDGAGLTCWVDGDELAAPGDYDELQAVIDRTAGSRGAGAMDHLRSVEAAVPAVPHLVCVYVAVHPSARGRGLGQRLVEPRLAEADRRALPVHLTSTNPRNLSFYDCLGFRPLGASRSDPTLPPIWSMWRDPSHEP